MTENDLKSMTVGEIKVRLKELGMKDEEIAILKGKKEHGDALLKLSELNDKLGDSQLKTYSSAQVTEIPEDLLKTLRSTVSNNDIGLMFAPYEHECKNLPEKTKETLTKEFNNGTFDIGVYESSTEPPGKLISEVTFETPISVPMSTDKIKELLLNQVGNGQVDIVWQPAITEYTSVDPTLDPSLNKVDIMEDPIVYTVPEHINKSVENLKNREFRPSDPEWNDYVLSHFVDEEMLEDKKGKKHPTVDGLRRVFELLMGPIVTSKPEIMKCPTGEDRSVTIRYQISFYDKNLVVKDREDAYRSIYGSADGGLYNIDGAFQKYVVSVTETRAEGRALRKALGLRKVLCAEEISDNVEEVMLNQPDDKISQMQMILIDRHCKNNDINLKNFINQYGNYNEINEVDKDIGSKMCQVLNEYNRGAIEIPESIKGYEATK